MLYCRQIIRLEIKFEFLFFMTKEELWQAILAQIQLNISQANFATWFKNTEIISWENDQIIISVPNSFAKEWLKNKYNKFIFKILYDLNLNKKEVKEIKYVISKTNLKTANLSPVKQKHPLPLPETEQLEFQEFKVNKQTNLNPRYIFENFVIGPFNELAQAAAWAVTESPGQVYNPLFVYGGVGLGKTHLVQAIGNKITKKFPQKKVKYVSSEKFTSEVITSIKNHTMEDFKLKHRAIDILILDDIQFLAGKEKTQEEFFHTFNSLYEKNKQIIISSDRQPKAIPTLTERLRSRFEGGMITDIGYPDYETRIAILKAKLQEKDANFSDDILDYIASNIQRNIRELEGALNKLVFHQKLVSQPLTLKNIESLFKPLIFSPKKFITPKKIIQVVADFYDIKEKNLLSSLRKKEIVKPRQIVMYLLREELKNSYPFIGEKLGKKDHTTIIHGCKKISKELETNKNLTEEIDLIKQRILSG